MTDSSISVPLPTNPRFENLSDQPFGRLKVKRYVGKEGKHQFWQCDCKCGKSVKVSSNHLKSGHTQSCGCHSRDMAARTHTKHGHAINHKLSPEYRTWRNMINRCTNPKTTRYENYGGRGITVCSHWHVFGSFLEDMGKKPSDKYSLERRDNEKGYEPDNCYWATPAQQARNRRSSHRIAYNGEHKTLADWADSTGIPYATLNKRINKLGWEIDRALTTPLAKRSRLNQPIG